MKKIFLLLAASLLGMTACTTNPYTGESQASRTGIGAGIGAVGGALVGLLTGDDADERRRNALIGAGIGALGGGGVGLYMDRQEAALRQRLQNSGVSVTRQGNQITLNMPGNITFDTGSSAIKGQFFEILNSVAIVLKEFDQTYIDVAGHTDDVGSTASNQVLSEQRAQSVAQYLISQGVLSQRFWITGYGENRPIAPNNSEAGRAQNRRVEIQLRPLT